MRLQPRPLTVRFSVGIMRSVRSSPSITTLTSVTGSLVNSPSGKPIGLIKSVSQATYLIPPAALRQSRVLASVQEPSVSYTDSFSD